MLYIKQISFYIYKYKHNDILQFYSYYLVSGCSKISISLFEPISNKSFNVCYARNWQLLRT